MDVKTILDYVIPGIEWLVLGGATYLATIMTAQGTSHIFSKKIHSQGELDKVIEKETKNLDIDGSKIKGHLHTHFFTTHWKHPCGLQRKVILIGVWI